MRLSRGFHYSGYFPDPAFGGFTHVLAPSFPVFIRCVGPSFAHPVRSQFPDGVTQAVSLSFKPEVPVFRFQYPSELLVGIAFGQGVADARRIETVDACRLTHTFIGTGNLSIAANGYHCLFTCHISNLLPFLPVPHPMIPSWRRTAVCSCIFRLRNNGPKSRTCQMQIHRTVHIFFQSLFSSPSSAVLVFLLEAFLFFLPSLPFVPLTLGSPDLRKSSASSRCFQGICILRNPCVRSWSATSGAFPPQQADSRLPPHSSGRCISLPSRRT